MKDIINPPYLNKRLLESQGVSPSDHQSLIEIHIKLKSLFQSIKNKYKSAAKDQLQDWVFQVEEFEFEMQRLWGFDINANYHTHWLKMPGCSCPHVDNAERFGIHRITSGDCIWHSDL